MSPPASIPNAFSPAAIPPVGTFPGAVPAAPDMAEAADTLDRLGVLQGYIGVFVVAFLASIIATPILRRLAIANGIIDHPSDPRKVHKVPIAYLGGIAVYVGILAAIFYSFLALKFPLGLEWHPSSHLDPGSGWHPPVPLSVLLGITIITLVGVIDDVAKISPRVKVGGQLIAAAALAIDNVGVRLAGGLLLPIFKSIGVPTQQAALSDGTLHETVLFLIPLPLTLMGATHVPIDMIYWIGTGIIAISVLALCNASNLIDGLDGLLSGVTAIANMGLLVVALTLALHDDGPRDAQRIVLCLAILGACMGFLPHNFNPATIFLGDAGSLLLGFCTCVVILTLGDTGRTELVVVGLIIYAVPIIDTALAIVRRKMEGKSISAADDQHLHHMLKRALGVKGAVMALYAIGASFAALGAMVSLTRARVVYVLALVLASYIGVTAIKIARRKYLEAHYKPLTPPPGPDAAASTASMPTAAAFAAVQPVAQPVAQSAAEPAPAARG